MRDNIASVMHLNFNATEMHKRWSRASPGRKRRETPKAAMDIKGV